MKDILKHKILRRNFYITIIAILAVLFLLKFIIDDFVFLTIVKNIVDGLLVTIITTLLVGVFLFYLTPENTDEKTFELIARREVKSNFDNALRNSSIWKFKGGFGRYFRIAVIPFLSIESSRLHKSIEIIGIILNPNNKELCKKYADYRNSVQNFDNNNKWNYNLVKEELFATIVTALLCHQKKSLLEIKLYVTDYFSPTRIDISSNIALLTKIDKDAPTIRVARETYFYQSYEQEIAISKLQDKQITYLTKNYSEINSLSVDEVIKILKECEVYDEELEEESYKSVLQLVKSKDNPYVQ